MVMFSSVKKLVFKIAVASIADRIKVNANLNAAGLPVPMYEILAFLRMK